MIGHDAGRSDILAAKISAKRVSVQFEFRDISEEERLFSDLCIRAISSELIRRIRESEDDPIQVVSQVYSELDYILGDSDDDHFETHRFAAKMEYECGEVLRYLRTVERKKNEDAKN